MRVTVGATIRLRADKFDLMTRILGCENEPARAELIGVTARTISRARAGLIGEAFMAKTIHALRQRLPELQRYGLDPTLDELFEVTTEPAKPDGVAS